tara:strand:+ start:894 stop:1046 length:153 start_codon:yes stop_codon:yes gene_type:complete
MYQVYSLILCFKETNITDSPNQLPKLYRMIIPDRIEVCGKAEEIANSEKL